MTNTTETDRTEPAYEVGNCKPPLHTRFKPGQSGNPSGGSRKVTMRSAFRLAAMTETFVPEADPDRRVTLIEALMVELFQHARAGNRAAIAHVLALAGQHLDAEPWEPAEFATRREDAVPDPSDQMEE